MENNKLVLVTGGTGFVGIHCIVQLLEQGYLVKTTLRSMKRKKEVLGMLQEGGIASSVKLEFIETDLTNDKNWDKAVAGCDFVLHIASPIHLAVPKHEDDVILPAVNGTLRVLKAARDAGVKRVVLTSSFGAVGYSHTDPGKQITEESWTDPTDKTLSAYLKSKTLAERAAWDFIEKEGGDLELAVINPVGIFGPTLGADLSSGLELIHRLLTGQMKAVPNINFGVVDVRDVADLHLRAMTDPAAKGQRFLAIAGEVMSFPEIARLLKNKLGDNAKNVTGRVMKNWFLRIAALFSPVARNIVPQLGRIKNASNAKAKNLLNWKPRSNEEALLSAAESILRFNLVKK